MSNIFYSTPLKHALRSTLVLAVYVFSLGIGSINIVHATAASETDTCGQLLAEAEERFLATLAEDGSVPATPETKAAAQEYIRVSKLCYEEIEAQNFGADLLGETPTFIDDGGLFFDNGLSAEFVFPGSKWGTSTPGTSGGTVTYSFMGNGISFSDENAKYGNNVAITSLPGFQTCFITDIQAAFAAWQAVANIQFVHVTDSGSGFNAAGASGDIRIGAHYFDGASGILAHAYYPPPNGTTAAGDMHFDRSENWTCNPGGIDIGVVALHEIGHSLGLAHENTPTAAVMDPVYDPQLYDLHSDDINGATTIYGVAQLADPPINDTIASALSFSTVPYSNSVVTTGANQTPDPNDPTVNVLCDEILLNKGDNTVWYKYSPDSNKLVSIDTLESNYDTYIAVWTGTENNLSFVACDDDSASNLQSQLFLNAQAGTYYIQVAGYTGTQGNTVEDNRGGNLEFRTSNVPGTGKYDDTNSNWRYSGSWGAYSGGEPYYNNTTHYTLTVGDSASFAFNGTQFILSYAQATNRGMIGVYVDGEQVGTINANGTLQYQKTYVSPVFPSGPHIAEFKFLGGTGPAMDVDAIEILNTAAPGVGKYDDTNTNWAYTGSWAAYSGAGGYTNNTTHYTASMGDRASFTFSGTQFILTYATHPLRGILDVFVDGTEIGSINQNGPAQIQKLYISPTFANGVHVVQFRHAGGGGPYVGVDTIEIRATAASGVNTYDDVDTNWVYSGSWAAYSGSDPYYLNTTHYTAAVGDSASFTFTGTQFVLTYATHPMRGLLDVYVDGSKVGSINQNGPLMYINTYTSPIFPAGTHVAQFIHAGGAGPYVGVDAIQILATTIPGTGTYDDANAGWNYTGSWAAYSGSDPYYLNTTHYTTTVGDTASFTFSGTQFLLTYATHPLRGLLDVYVDGWKIGSLNQNGAFVYINTYTSPVFPAGTHIVQFVHAGGAGPYVGVDAIQIKATAAPGVGIYDDFNPNWVYTGAWAAYSGSDPYYLNTTHYTVTVGDRASFTFTGTQFILTYATHPLRGLLDVYVDGAKVDSINENGPFVYINLYTSPVFSAGTHLVQFRHVGGAGPYVGVDAIEVK